MAGGAQLAQPALAQADQVAAAPDGFHQGIEHHHRLGADALPVLIHRAAVGAGVFVAGFFPVPAVAFRMISPQESCHFNRELIFLVIPLFHTDLPYVYIFLQFFPSAFDYRDLI